MGFVMEVRGPGRSNVSGQTAPDPDAPPLGTKRGSGLLVSCPTTGTLERTSLLLDPPATPGPPQGRLSTGTSRDSRFLNSSVAGVGVTVRCVFALVGEGRGLSPTALGGFCVSWPDKVSKDGALAAALDLYGRTRKVGIA